MTKFLLLKELLEQRPVVAKNGNTCAQASTAFPHHGRFQTCLTRPWTEQSVNMASKKMVYLLGNQSKFCKINSPILTFGVRNKASWEPTEKETHTGQKWDKDDYRLVRFVDKPKQVNPNWAIDLIAEVPPTASTKRVVACDGGGGPTGHPKVYINLDKPGNHSCNYCGLRFYKEDGHH